MKIEDVLIYMESSLNEILTEEAKKHIIVEDGKEYRISKFTHEGCTFHNGKEEFFVNTKNYGMNECIGDWYKHYISIHDIIKHSADVTDYTRLYNILKGIVKFTDEGKALKDVTWWDFRHLRR